MRLTTSLLNLCAAAPRPSRSLRSNGRFRFWFWSGEGRGEGEGRVEDRRGNRGRVVVWCERRLGLGAGGSSFGHLFLWFSNASTPGLIARGGFAHWREEPAYQKLLDIGSVQDR